MMVRWINGRIATDADSVDTTVYEGEAIALAAWQGPAVIVSFGDWRLYFEGEDSLASLLDACLAAHDEHQRSTSLSG